MSIPDEKDERFTDMVQIVSTDEKEVLKQIKNSISIYKSIRLLRGKKQISS